MKKSRQLKLLQNAARCFDQMYSPFTHSELSKLDVTADECKDLSALIGSIIREHIYEDVEPNSIMKYLHSLGKSQRQITKTRDVVASFGMDSVDMPSVVLKLAVIRTDKIREDMGFLMNFVRLDVLRQINRAPPTVTEVK